MNVVLKPKKMTEQEYLEYETASDVRHEYIDGERYAMVGGTFNHARLVGNISGEIRNHLKGKKCEVFAESTKLKLPVQYKNSNYFYPDVVVDCSVDQAEQNMLSTPVLLIEVVSVSSHRHDKMVKRHLYEQIPTLQEYIVVEQHQVEINIYRRRTGWNIEQYFLGDEISFESIGLTVTVEELYDRVDNEEMQLWLQDKI